MPDPSPAPRQRGGRRPRQILLSDATVAQLDELGEAWQVYSDTGQSTGSPNRSAIVERLIEEAHRREHRRSRR